MRMLSFQKQTQIPLSTDTSDLSHQARVLNHNGRERRAATGRGRRGVAVRHGGRHMRPMATRV